MAWWLWMLVGAAVLVLACVIVAYITELVDSRVATRRRDIRSRQTAAEQQMQAIVQNTIEQMFSATRWRP